MQSSVNEFLTPRVIKVDEKSATRAQVTLEPLERGFGHSARSSGLGLGSGVRSAEGAALQKAAFWMAGFWIQQVWQALGLPQ